MKRKHWFYSDPHFNHGNILKYCRRTCWLNENEKKLLEQEAIDKTVNLKVSQESIQKMNAKLIKNINDLVAPDDVMWFLGDWCFAPNATYFQVAKSMRDQIACQTIHAIWGNHDQRSVLAPLFTTDHEYVEVSIDPITGDYWMGADVIKSDKRSKKGQLITLCHYAQAVWDRSHHNAWDFYGHSHSSAEMWLDKMMPGRKSIDVGVDNIAIIFGNKKPEDYRPASFCELKPVMDKRVGASIDHH